MSTIAPATAEGSWLLAGALLRCDAARDRLDAAIAGLRALDDDMPWRSKAVTALRGQLVQHEGELRDALGGLGDVETALRR